MNKKREIPWGTLGVITLAAILGLVVVRSFLLAGPQTVPTERDRKQAQREAKPASGTDERLNLPAGDYVSGYGVVEPQGREVNVSSRVPGRIDRVLVNEGDKVEAGAVIIEFESAPERAALSAAEADVAGARADLDRTARGLRREDVDAAVAEADAARARAQNTAEQLARQEQLRKSGAATDDEVDRAKRQAEADKASFDATEARKKAALGGGRSEDVAASRARLAAAEARREQAKATLDQLTVRAPFAGEILQVKYRPGEYFAPSPREPLVVMGDTRVLRVRVDVDERDLDRVRLGAPAFATSIAFPGRRVSGKLIELGRRMGRKNVRTDDPVERLDTKIIECVIELSESKDLVPGLRVTGYIEAAKSGK